MPKRFLKVSREKSTNYIDKFIPEQPCFVCLTEAHPGLDIVPAHQNRNGGKMGGKDHDLFALPLCAIPCHDDEHNHHDKLIQSYEKAHGVIVESAQEWDDIIGEAIDDHMLRFLRWLGR